MLLLLVLAQAATVAAAPGPAQTGVTSYAAAYFADLQTANASEMLNRLPGFQLDTGNSSRGFEGSAGNVLIDGQRPASKTDSLDEILRRMPIGVVERIEVIRGGAPGIDMQGKTILANVIRKKGAATRLLISAAQTHAGDGRTLGAIRVEGSGSLGDRKWEFGTLLARPVGGGAGSGPGLKIPADGSARTVSFIKSEGDGHYIFASGSVESPLAGGALKVNGRLASDKYKYNEDNNILSPVRAVETDDEVQIVKDTEIGGTFNRAFGSRANLQLVALRQTKDRDYTAVFATSAETDDFRLNRQTSEAIGRAALKYRFTERLSGEAGAETALNKLDSHTRFFVNAAAVTLPAANVLVEEKRSELFLKGAWRPTGQWTIDAGLRYESSTISSGGDVVLGKTLHFLKPRLAATWAPNGETQVLLRVEREVGQLNFNDFVASADLSSASGVTAGNPDLNPQQAWVGEAAIEQRFWGSGSIALTARHYRLTDAVDRGPVRSVTRNPITGLEVVSFFDRPTNIGSGTKDELALTATVPFDRLGLKGLQAKGDVTRRWSEVTDPTTGRKREISGLLPIEWNASFVYDVPARHFSWGVDVYGSYRLTYYRFNLVETTKGDSYVRPFAEWRPRPDINLRFEVGNATAREVRRTVLVYPGPLNAGGAPEVRDRDLTVGRVYYFRVRKTFGG
jgi:outer membrane receptor protein involved in Fe transport